jgi:hypothetical protein
MKSRELVCFQLLAIFILASTLATAQDTSYQSNRIARPFVRCISNTDCTADEYCSSNSEGQVGRCQSLLSLNESCVTNRQCYSAVCHYYMCVERIPERGAECVVDDHTTCNADQYCMKRRTGYKCVDRVCKGLCSQHFQCLSDKCPLFWCISPDFGCPAWQLLVSILSLLFITITLFNSNLLFTLQINWK